MGGVTKLTKAGPVAADAKAQPIRVFVIEDQQLVRVAFCLLLNAEPGIQVCGAAATGKEALPLLAREKPDVIVTDYFLEGGNEGSELISEILSSKEHRASVLCVSMHREEDLGERAIRAGARGFLTKDRSPKELADAVRTLAKGEYCVSEWLRARLVDIITGAPQTPAPLRTLTTQELKVLRLIGGGLSLDDIAKRLGVAKRTVGTHRDNIKRKLGEATSKAVERWAWLWVTGGLGK